ncbi:protein FAM177A1-like isoform X1 [Scomber scombrus]|uniref:protein FAM177A1-like isoform X1 n=1 Tax=Scomber scombrus TaxID=13677 RepID=UPI002DDA7C23|nr:protein FAM177A1-like isoform X1 [Scomber scombrus]
MADISLYLTNVNVSIAQSMDVQQSPNAAKDFESVELGELDKREEQQEEQQREKVPRRIIHFSSGETMEEYSTDEEEEEDKEPERKDLLSSPVDAVRSKMTWGPYFWFHMWRAATSTVSACDYLGERMASLFGITSAKYQYAIDEYYRMKKEREEEREENCLSEEAERTFDQLPSQEIEDEPITMPEQPNVAAAHTDVTYQIENENKAPSNTIRVPAIVTAN